MWPFASFLDIPFEAFVAVFVWNIKVDNDVILRDFNIVNLRRINI